MPTEWVEICDAATANGRCTVKDMDEMCETYDPQFLAAPAIVGHVNSYPKDTRIPVGAWVESLKREGTKLFAKMRFPGKINVRAPRMFEQLQGMSEWFKEAVNKGLYETRSIGWGKHKVTGKAMLHHVGFLGAAVPESKGMPRVELAGCEEIELVELSDDEETQEFTVTNELATMNEASVAIILKWFGLEPDATEEMIEGAIKAKDAQLEKAKADALALANAGEMKPTVAPSFNLAEDPTFKKMQETIESLSTKLSELAEGDPANPAAPPAPPAPPTPPAGMTEEQKTQAVAAAKQKLEAANNWLPAFDTTLVPIMTLLAGQKVGEKDALEALSEALSALPEIAQLAEITDWLDIAELSEQGKKSKQSTGVNIALSHGEVMGDMTMLNEMEEYAKEHNVTLEEACRKHGLAV